ncbi:Flp family type IVb pilin [Pseudomonas cavernae]|uniref:Flp family type IVb pilin n=1 Tax=Pseudomonas cavernae TaxID=2320867 RepID=A0A385Z530_9PSED|nr:Flp family type IVb pilin [Pseudomonas cavernae]AYC32612.1 Flp family type IVb pilin [Pseudomonas cavernae]
MNLQTIKGAVMKFVKDEDGLTIVEYAVAGGLITVAAVGAFVTLGQNVNSKIGCMRDAVGTGATPGTACGGAAPAP